MFDGTLFGTITAIIYELFFLLTGIGIIRRVLGKETFSRAFLCLIGSVTGELSLQWFPVLFAFLFGFSMTAHFLALTLQIIIYLLVSLKYNSKNKSIKKCGPATGLSFRFREWKRFLKENPCIFLIVIFFFYFSYCLFTHTIPQTADGAIHTGQATYGDMNMHLSFITGIANQKTFPPDYSIFPGTRLSYPFLCDSISSSLYLFGASLRAAYLFPMLIAILQVFCGFYCFIKYWLKRAGTALLAWVLFFLNGGLGFLYFLNAESLQRNFTDFYYTPTSLGDMNMRWAQIIDNMLIPQRATLFGWAVLFPLLALFFCAVQRRSRSLFVLSGIFAGALPMIHTHSFLAFGLVCVMWLFYDCQKRSNQTSSNHLLRLSLPIGLAFFSILQIINSGAGLIDQYGLALMLAGLLPFAGMLLYRLLPLLRKPYRREFLSTWGLFLLIILLLAVPQLFYWTFSQAGGEGFVRGHFNWSNTGDQYIWFYIKNIGLAFVALLLAVLMPDQRSKNSGKRFLVKNRDLQIASPYLLIWFIAELVVFQPNDYDNNKLLFVGFVFICGLAAEVLMQLYLKKWNPALKVLSACFLLFTGLVSAVLTLGREWVSDYELYPAAEVEACRFIEEETGTRDVILTASNHNCPVPALTGRSIVCGSSSFLYYHGLDTSEREADIAQMYSDPVNSLELYHKYQVSYIYVSGQEQNAYAVNTDGLLAIADCIYNNDNVLLYRVK